METKKVLCSCHGHSKLIVMNNQVNPYVMIISMVTFSTVISPES